MEENQNLSKEPWLAVVLSSCLSGVGQIYAGRIQRGIILILIYVFLFFLCLWSWLIPKCDVLISIGLVLVYFTIRIWNLFDAHKCVRKANSQDFENERKQNKDPWLALFLSDIIPGLGQLYLRKWLLGMLFVIIGGLMLIVVSKYKLLYIGLWAILDICICFHAYISAPIRREKSKRVVLIVCFVFLCMHLLKYTEFLYKTYVFDAFKIGTPKYLNLMPPEHRGGPAMKPTLVYEDRVLVRKSKKYITKRGDVVVFRPPRKNSGLFIMRVAALANETIQIKDGMLYIDGEKVQWRPIEVNDYSPDQNGINEPYEVPEDCFFVLGDNSINSYDSRRFGAIPLSDLIGKAYKIYWPLSRRGPIE
jgi:signal peptidase I